MLDRTDLSALRGQARRAGVLYLGLTLFAIYGLMLVPGQLGISSVEVGRSIAAIQQHELLYRSSIVAHLISQLLFLFVVQALYRLFESTDARVAQAMRMLVLVSVPIDMLFKVYQLTAVQLATGALVPPGHSPEQVQGLVQLMLRLDVVGSRLVEVFWGLWLFPFGLLVVRSGFIPRVLGYLLWVAGAGYVLNSLVFMLQPSWVELLHDVVLGMVMCELPIIFWLLIWGVRRPAAG